MPTFKLRPIVGCDDDQYWVYALDEWDARDQVARALGVKARDETYYECNEDNRCKPPLNLIVHSDGSLTGVPAPKLRRCGVEMRLAK